MLGFISLRFTLTYSLSNAAWECTFNLSQVSEFGVSPYPGMHSHAERGNEIQAQGERISRGNKVCAF